MSLYQIPLPNDGTAHDYRLTVEIAGKDYRFLLRWNRRTETWFLSIYRDDGTALIESRAILYGCDVLRSCVTTGKPPGKIYALPTDGDWTPPGLTDFGRRVILYYQPDSSEGG